MHVLCWFYCSLVVFILGVICLSVLRNEAFLDHIYHAISILPSHLAVWPLHDLSA